MKEKAAIEVGLNSEIVRYPDSVEEKTVLEKIDELNKDETVSGILVQLPLPKHINKQRVIEAINPGKDVDGFHPMNVGNLSSGYESSVPCTPLGCYLLIKKIEPNLSGKKAVVVGRSNLNGKPMTQLLLKENCTVTITHSRTKAIFRRLDHSAIYLLIAGTYTPVILISLRTTWVIFLLPIIWAMALLGVYVKVYYIHRFERFSLAQLNS